VADPGSPDAGLSHAGRPFIDALQFANTGSGAWSREANLQAWEAYLGEEFGTDRVSPYAAPARADDLTRLPPTYVDVGDLESWRERDLGEEVEYYFAVKKQADVALSRSGLNWLILRPSLLLDGPGTGTVSLGPAELHGEIARDDVAATLAELLHEPRIGRQILELDTGPTPIEEAVRANVPS
jgi:hypothetical protein